jgi:hypothetical protein
MRATSPPLPRWWAPQTWRALGPSGLLVLVQPESPRAWQWTSAGWFVPPPQRPITLPRSRPSGFSSSSVLPPRLKYAHVLIVSTGLSPESSIDSAKNRPVFARVHGRPRSHRSVDTSGGRVRLARVYFPPKAHVDSSFTAFLSPRYPTPFIPSNSDQRPTHTRTRSYANHHLPGFPGYTRTEEETRCVHSRGDRWRPSW